MHNLIKEHGSTNCYGLCVIQADIVLVSKSEEFEYTSTKMNNGNPISQSHYIREIKIVLKIESSRNCKTTFINGSQL